MAERRSFLRAFALTSILTFTACQTTPQVEPKSDVAADMKGINTLLDQFTAAFNSGDAAAVTATHTDDAILFFPNQEIVEGKEAIQIVYERMLQKNANGATRMVAFSPLETQVAGNWAYERGNGTVTITTKSGRPTEESFRYLDIYRRQPDGSWKIYRDMVNNGTSPTSAAGEKR